MRKNTHSSKLNLWSSYLIFFLSLVSIAILYLGWLNVQAAAPQVLFSRSNNNIEVTVTPGSNDELKFLRDSNNNAYWDYGPVATKSDCDQGGFSDTGNALRRNEEDVVEFTISTTPISDQYFCLKVLYGQSNSQQFKAHYAGFLFDVTAPEITVEQTATTLTAQADDSSDIESWSYYSETNSNTVDCSTIEDGSYTVATSTNNNLIINVAVIDDNKWYCFKAVDEQGNMGYSDAFQVDTVAPSLMVEQIQDSALITLTVVENSDVNVNNDEDIDVDSWQYVQTTQVCDSGITGWRDLDILTTDLNQDRAAITFTKSNSGRTYCFRVADQASNYAYARHEVDTINEPPVINSLRQEKKLVTATARDVQYLNADSWQYAVVDSQTCNDGVSTNWQGLEVTGFSVADNGQAILDLAQIDINENTSDKWLCFRVADNIQTNYGYRSIDVDADAPIVDIRQSNASLRASAPSSDGAVSSTWSYVKNSNDFDCDEDAFEIYTPVNRGSSVSLVKADVGDYFCFRVADRYDNYGYGDTYKVRSLDTIAPKIKATQSNKYLMLSASASEGIDHDTWEYAGGFSSEQDCDEMDASRYSEIDNRSLTLNEGDIGDWFCIRAADEAGNYGYLSIRIRVVDATFPYITVTQDRNILTASTDANDVDESTWQYASSAIDDDFDCEADNASLQFNVASAANDRVVLDSTDDSRYYCFRVADKADNYGYARSAKIIDVEPAPVITVIQRTDERRLEIFTNASDVDGWTWGWAVFNSDPGDCESVNYTDIVHDQITQNTRRIFVNDIADSQNGSYYCFRVADTSTVYGDNYGYVKHQYSLSRPVITFSLANDVLTVSSDSANLNASTWRYAKFASQPNCAQSDVNQTLPTNNAITLTATDNGSWLCFKVADRSGNFGYNIYEIKGIVAPVEQSVPQIDAVQEQQTVIATSSSQNLNSKTWRYAASVEEPNCGPGNSLSFNYNQGSPTKINLTELRSDYNWLCFKVTNTSGNVGYAKIRIDRKAPVIQITQNNVVLVVESSDSDLDGTTWGYARKTQDFDCDSDVDFIELDSDNSKISFDLMDTGNESNYYCFKVADKVGNVGYKKIQVSPIDMKAPVITIKHRNTSLTVSAANVDNSSWQYVRIATDINCSVNGNLNFNQASSNNQTLRLSEADNGYWFCFKVRGLNKKVGYAKILVDNVDSRVPVVKVRQDGNTMTATANEDISYWQYTVLTSTSSRCAVNAFSNQEVMTGNSVNLTGKDNQVTYCFRAVDHAGNAGYGALTASVEADDDVDEADDDSAEKEEDVDTTSEDDDDKTGSTASDDDDGDWIPIAIGAALGLAIVISIILIVLSRDKKNDNDNNDYI